jgi:hypothetical protein
METHGLLHRTLEIGVSLAFLNQHQKRETNKVLLIRATIVL